MRLLTSVLLLISTTLTAAFDCGPGIGPCPAGQCCSESNWCGSTVDYCKGPQCQLDYSDSCDAFKPPPGVSTASIARPKVGSVPYGQIITHCTVEGHVALTFDDGPWVYTNEMLDILQSLNVTATFFIVGNNLGKGRMDDPTLPWPAMMQRMNAAGHQMASHSWTHQDLGLVNSTIQQTQVIYNEMAFRNLFGFFPTYFRCPYLDCTTASGSIDLLNNLGYHIIDMDIDTKDYLYDDATLIQTSKNIFSTAVSSDAVHNSYIPLAHDIHYQTVVNLTSYMINTLRARGYTPVTVGECLGDPRENWYRDASGASSSSTSSIISSSTAIASQSSSPTTVSSSTSIISSSSTSSTAPSSTGLVVSPNQSCGGTTGYTCQGSRFGNCCSFYGFCGSTTAYCGTGCKTAFGSCNPTSTGLTVTTNGLCGATYNTTCLGYGIKQCCSQYGYCGNTTAYCGTGCQTTYGVCS